MCEVPLKSATELDLPVGRKDWLGPSRVEHFIKYI